MFSVAQDHSRQERILEFLVLLYRLVIACQVSNYSLTQLPIA